MSQTSLFAERPLVARNAIRSPDPAELVAFQTPGSQHEMVPERYTDAWREQYLRADPGPFPMRRLLQHPDERVRLVTATQVFFQLPLRNVRNTPPRVALDWLLASEHERMERAGEC